MLQPFSILRSKRKQKVIIEEKKENYQDNKNIKVEFERQLDDLIQINGLYVNNDDLSFITQNMQHFYHNNVAILFLTMNIERDPYFTNSEHYNLYIQYILRGKNLTNMDTFYQKLNVSIKTYKQKIIKVAQKLGYNFT